MGTTASKPSSGAPHEWKGSGPVGATQDLVNSIQSSKETDASRARLMELHIEARVAEKLRELQARENATLNETREKIALEDGPSDDNASSSLTSQKVSKEIETLRARLESRKTVKELPEGVETARSNVIRCLRENDRRPLNCYEEVEAFKVEVRKLEKGWVDKTLA
ncbi:related to ochre suppressor tyr-tRNA [Cephalotrichum gorgonifer]|uniref:Related to ochre suppressor tyr-tRNA n=1 Tax=Cephalotrichum gorgonifer TaxID=2041049 RepID=A0AAE8MUY9_9PEZI|nr:related to ochre suppressor tyr-tRNA [Cephalotrichum gorgonifer]